MPSSQHAPTRTLRHPSDLAQLERQAKELLKAFAAGDARAVAEVNAHYHGAHAGIFALHVAQLVLARSYGFASWPRLKAYVDGVTVRRLADAAGAGDLEAVRSMLAARPELAGLDIGENDEHQALHHAVLKRQPEVVRLLMQHGADPRKGIHPYRDATSALMLATERGYTDIVRVIHDEEKRRASHRVIPFVGVPRAGRVLPTGRRVTVTEVLSLCLLSAFIWVVGFLLPKAPREDSRFGVVCSLLAAMVALFGWLFIGGQTYSG